MRLLYQLPTWLQRFYHGVVWRKNTSSKVVYLTFDDGPVPEVTPQVLDILKQYNVRATFFMVGENAQQYPQLLKRVREEGHSVGNHTFNHIKGTSCDAIAYMSNVVKADEVLHSLLFRPPYGKMTTDEKKSLLQQGYTIYLWDVLTHDYNQSYTAEKIIRIVDRYVRNGSIINFHDSVKAGERMLQALPIVIENLKAKGYSFDKL